MSFLFLLSHCFVLDKSRALTRVNRSCLKRLKTLECQLNVNRVERSPRTFTLVRQRKRTLQTLCSLKPDRTQNADVSGANFYTTMVLAYTTINKENLKSTQHNNCTVTIRNRIFSTNIGLSEQDNLKTGYAV